jgi:GT2 family glycosyltransferase
MVSPNAIDIVVPVYKSVYLTTRCLQSLAANIHELSAYSPRLILINDSPGEAGVAEMLASFAHSRSDVVLLENEANQGFVGAVNRGLQIACRETRDVILVNADTETFPGTLANLVAVAHSDPQIAFVSPRSNNASLCSLPHLDGGIPSTQDEAYARWRLLSRTMPPYHFAPTAVGFYLYIKHLVIANFGLLDTAFGAGYEEENDLILRANKAGYRAVVANGAFAYHAGSASFSLTDLDLSAHRDNNLQAVAQRHPEFLPLLRRYERSPHFRAEALLERCLPSATGRLTLVCDLSSLGCHFNGTSEQSVAIIANLCARHRTSFEVSVICSEAAFKFHGLDQYDDLRRHEPERLPTERFSIAVRLGQPFDLEAIDTVEQLAPINIYGMLDTIAEDCGYLSITHRLGELWGYVARHSNGIFFNSKFTEQEFLSRFPDAMQLSRYARLLSTKLADYRKGTASTAAEHVMIVGNHFAHKASETTAAVLSTAFPTVEFVVLGGETRLSANVRSYRAGTLTENHIEQLYCRASVVVLPSHVEGFGFGLVHALAAGKVVVARDIPTTREILATYKTVSGVFLFRNDLELVATLRTAMAVDASRVDDSAAQSWDDWVDGFVEFCSRLLAEDDVFPRLVRRLTVGDLLRRAELSGELGVAESFQARPDDGSDQAAIALTTGEPTRRRYRALSRVNRGPARNLRELLTLNGEEFVHAAYATIFGRAPDVSGLENYLGELDSGVSKFAIISRLRNSAEGQRKRLPLAGFTRAAIARRVLSSIRALKSKI